jgi:hypothetical protein
MNYLILQNFSKNFEYPFQWLPLWQERLKKCAGSIEMRWVGLELKVLQDMGKGWISYGPDFWPKLDRLFWNGPVAAINVAKVIDMFMAHNLLA